MRIEFFNRETGLVDERHDYFVLCGNEVWRDNYETCESQCAVVGFDDFIMKCPEIDWRVVE